MNDMKNELSKKPKNLLIPLKKNLPVWMK